MFNKAICYSHVTKCCGIVFVQYTNVRRTGERMDGQTDGRTQGWTSEQYHLIRSIFGTIFESTYLLLSHIRSVR